MSGIVGKNGFGRQSGRIQSFTELSSSIVAYSSTGGELSGWSEYTGARGRMIVGLPSGGTNSGTVGTALTDTQDKTVAGAHTHTGPSHTHTGPSHQHADPQLNYASGTGMWFPSDDSTPFGTVAHSVSDFNTNQVARNDMPPLSSLITVGDAEWMATSFAGTGATGSAGTGATGSAGASVSTSDVLSYIQLMSIQSD